MSMRFVTFYAFDDYVIIIVCVIEYVNLRYVTIVRVDAYMALHVGL